MNVRCKLPPVFAGILIGLVMLIAFVISGRGIGVSGALTRMIAVAQNTISPERYHPQRDRCAGQFYCIAYLW